MSTLLYRLSCADCRCRFSARRKDARYCSVKCRMSAMRKRHKFNSLNVHFSSRGEEWYTPPHVIALARTVLRVIDLDPASCEQANEVVQAKHFFAVSHDGLTQAWSGTIWLNPPYGKVIGAWVEKVCHEYEAGQVNAALVLLPARPGSTWWRRISSYPMCFLHGRLRFSGATHAPFPSVVVYLGTEPYRFAEAFAKSGVVVSPLSL
jgi:DNA N-6-adenine-methyltransferase (Dam)